MSRLCHALRFARACFSYKGLAVLAGVFVLAAVALPQLTRGDAQVPGGYNALVRWHEGRHDWLLVADRATREVVIYDATDGRPLHRLGRRQGLADVDALVQQGSWLFVLGNEHPRVRVLKLPQLQPVDLAAR